MHVHNPFLIKQKTKQKITHQGRTQKRVRDIFVNAFAKTEFLKTTLKIQQRKKNSKHFHFTGEKMKMNMHL